jgi:hypothetical protein
MSGPRMADGVVTRIIIWSSGGDHSWTIPLAVICAVIFGIAWIVRKNVFGAGDLFARILERVTGIGRQRDQQSAGQVMQSSVEMDGVNSQAAPVPEFAPSAPLVPPAAFAVPHSTLSIPQAANESLSPMAPAPSALGSRIPPVPLPPGALQGGDPAPAFGPPPLPGTAMRPSVDPAVVAPVAVPPMALPDLPPMPAPFVPAQPLPPVPVPAPIPAAMKSGVIADIPGVVPLAASTAAVASNSPAVVIPVETADAIGSPTVSVDDDFDETRVVSAQSEWQVALADGRVLSVGSTMRFGRDPIADPADPGVVLVPLADPARSLSKTHAQIEARPGELLVTDLHSTNGTAAIVNGLPRVLAPGAALAVTADAELRFGDYVVQVRRDASAIRGQWTPS